MSMNKQDYIARITARKVERVNIEGVGEVCLRPLTLKARFDVQALVGEGRLFDAMATTITGALCDDDGALLFDDPAQVADIDGTVLEKIATEAMRVSGLDRASHEDAEKN